MSGAIRLSDDKAELQVEMVDWFIRHPSFAGIRRIGLVTRDAHGVYEASGFHALLRPERYMERLAPEFAQMLREAP